MRRPIVFMTYLLPLVMPTVCMAQIAYLHSSQISEGDVATLVVEYQNEIPSLFHLDTSPLGESFQVLEIRPRVTSERVNDKIINTMRWEVLLYPRKTGTITIPPLTIKGEMTPELHLDVIDKSSIENSGEQMYLKVTASPQNPRVQEQTLITVQFIYNKSLARGRLSEPKIQQGNIYPIGRDRHFQKAIDGETFNIIERKLALFAESPGILVYPAVEFLGKIEPNNLADDTAFKRQFKRESLPLVLDIQSRAISYSGKYWLPAADIKVSQQWHGIDGELTTGDSVGRSLTIQAQGLPASALPEDLFNLSNANLIVYTEKAQIENSVTNDRLTGLLTQSHAIVITGQGEIWIPEISFSWWDTDDSSEKKVTLPGKTITVLPLNVTKVNNAPVLTGVPAINPDYLTRVKQWLLTNFQWLLGIVGGALVLIVYGYAVKVKRKRQFVALFRFSRSLFKQACLSDDASTARTQLIARSRELWPGESITGLNPLKSRSNSVDFCEQLTRLDAALFAQRQDRWQGRQLWQAFLDAGNLKRGKASTNRDNLPGLYPL